MRELVENAHDYASSKPLLAGVLGTVAGWGTAISSWLKWANEIFSTLGAIFGSIAAFYTALILIRNVHFPKKDKDEND